MVSLAWRSAVLFALVSVTLAVHNLDHPLVDLAARSLTTDANSVDGSSFDFVIVGGGLAGLAVAARLSEWSNVTVLVVEAGGDGSDVADQINVPGYSYLNSLTGSAYDWQYQTVPQTDSGNGTKNWPRGKGLGGSGAINGMFWCRGDEEDYNAWATLNPGAEQTWNWAEMNKYMNKAENFTAAPAAVQAKFGMVLDASAHGSGGPIQSGFSNYIFDVVANWIPTWINVGLQAKDLWAGSTHGVMITPSTLNVRNGTRSDSKAGYIDPLPPRENLVILTGQQVTKIVFNGTTDANGNVLASGITFQAAKGGTAHSVQANKEVILSGGTIGSAQVLQLSGVGPSTLLSGLGIKTVLDLPVGYNLQDHVSYSLYWSAPANVETWGTFSAVSAEKATQLTQWRQDGTGMWTYVNEAIGYPSMSDILSAAEATTYQTTVKAAIASTVADMQSWQNLPDNVISGLTDQYNIMAGWLTTEHGQLEILLTALGQGPTSLGIQVALQHPWSRGTIMITSADAFTPPAINPDYFGVGYDIDIMTAGSNFARTLATTAPLSSVMTAATAPLSTLTGDALGTYIKSACGTEYHPLGTCSMLPKAKGGVVDTNLIVYGSNNLRVIDASIMPLEISAHLMATTYGIAEKGADMIKARWAAQAATVSVPSGSTGGVATTAKPGKATDTSVTNANAALNAKEQGMSTGGKIGLGVGLGAAALLILGIVVFIFLARRRRQADSAAYAAGLGRGAPFAGEKFANSPASSAPGMLTPPIAPYPHDRQYSITPSEHSYDNVELMARPPMRSESGYGLNSLPHDVPQRDIVTPSLEQSQRVPAAGFDMPWPREQRYTPVVPR